MTLQTTPLPVGPRRPLRVLVFGLALRVLGLRRDAGAPLGIRAGPLFFAWVAAAALFVLGSAGSIYYTSRPQFCSTCHNIRPYYRSWSESKHRNVGCLTCHTAPGIVPYVKRKLLAVSEVAQYVTRTFEPRPRSRIVDASCIRAECHPVEKLAQPVPIKVARPDATVMEFTFSHEKHLKKIGDKQLRCVSCHLQITQDAHFQVRAGVCFLCHLRGSTLNGAKAPQLVAKDKACTVCHAAPVGTLRLATGTYNHAEYIAAGADCRSCHQDTIRGVGEVNVETCLHCHGEPDLLAARADTARMHEKHVATHDAECFDCHFPIEHRFPEHRVPNVGQCGTCHGGSHEMAAFMYEGRGGRGVAPMPGPMFRTHVECQACHREDRMRGLPPGQRVTEAACRTCHGTKYEGRLAELTNTARQLLAETETAVANAERASLALPPERKEKARPLLEDARYNLEFVRGAGALHNVNYAVALLNVSKALALDALRLAEGR